MFGDTVRKKNILFIISNLPKEFRTYQKNFELTERIKNFELTAKSLNLPKEFRTY